MKFAMMAVALAATGAVRGDDVLSLDDFEKSSAKRVGEPALVSGMTSPGLLTQTRMGVYLFDSGYLLAWKKEPPYEFKVGSVECLPQDVKYGWSARNTAKTVLHLPAGRHVLRLVMDGNYNFGTLTFKR